MTKNDDKRPDPDELLNQITAQKVEEEKQSKGKLKVFFGACAGVGKTYAMLSAGQQAFSDGHDVLIGVVETHGRKDTEKLLDDVPILPRRDIEYKGAILKEFDLDAALERKPQLILIDELAHSNAPGSRHPKRWQDIEELLDAGIDVYTTINVQHIDSLNDVVARITGVWVRETVPDAFFDSADAISLVDIPTEELLQRLREGKVYIAPGAKQRAAKNFFQKSNLIALRELALRRTAEKVDAQMDAHKNISGKADAWSGADKVLVCIGPDELSSKLVRVAKRTSDGLRAPWKAIYVENAQHYNLGEEAKAAVDRTLKLAERMGGGAKIIKGENAPRAIIDYARKHNYTKIVVGKIPRPKFWEIVKGTLADNIIRISGNIDIHVVTGEAKDKNQFASASRQQPITFASIAFPLLITAIVTAICYPLRESLDVINLSSFYFIAIVWLALRFGQIASFIGALCSAIAFNYFLLPPFMGFKTMQASDIISPIVMALTGLVIARLTSKLRLQAIYTQEREENTAALYALSSELTATRGKKNLVDTAARHIGHILNADISVWLPNEQGELTCFMAERPQDESEYLREESAANWSFSHRQPAGLGTDTLPNASGYYIPMISDKKAIGVVGLLPEAKEALNTEQLGLLENIVNIIGTAVDRANSAELVERTAVESEGEKLRNIILSSVSHDLRTPLAAISGAASTLLLEEHKISKEYASELLRLVHEEAARLARMVTNLLDVTSLQSGSVRLNKELYFIEELISSAIMRMESRLGRRHIDIQITPGLPLVKMDGLLIEQVLINLIENMVEHTPGDTSAQVIAEVHKPDLHIIFKDNGPGIAAGDEEKIFDRFYINNAANHGKEGAIGLAICRGIITAHGGKIWAQNLPEGGAMFTFTLPLRQDAEEEK